MSSRTRQVITAELARMRMWRRLGDDREAELCNDRINNLLDMLFSGTPSQMVVDSF
jgi:hypothetical protein